MATRRGAKASQRAGKPKSLSVRGLTAKQAKGIKGGFESVEHGAGAGAGAGKTKFNEFNITKTSD